MEATGGFISLGSAAFVLVFATKVAASEVPKPVAPARASRSGCAKLLCQRRAPRLDTGPGHESALSPAPSAAVRVGIGAGAFHGPRSTADVWPLIVNSDGTRVEPYGSHRLDIKGSTLSLGAALRQPLLSAGALRWELEERFSLLALLTLSRGSGLAGAIDTLLVVREASLPLHLALGPSLSVAHLDPHDKLVAVDNPVVIPALAASLRLDLGALALDLTGHLGRALTNGGAYRDLQLALVSPL